MIAKTFVHPLDPQIRRFYKMPVRGNEIAFDIRHAVTLLLVTTAVSQKNTWINMKRGHRKAKLGITKFLRHATRILGHVLRVTCRVIRHICSVIVLSYIPSLQRRRPCVF